MKKEVKQGFVFWVGFAFFTVFGIIIIILNGGDINTLGDNISMLIGGSIAAVIVILMTFKLDSKVKKSADRVYR